MGTEIILYYAVFVTVAIGCFTSISESAGYVTLHPAPAQVCVGRQLEVTCTTNETSLVWNFVPHLMDNQGASVQREWLIASEDLTQQLQQFTINSTSFTFVRTSMPNESPLVSTLTITNSGNALNMINVSCTEVIGVELAMTVLTTIFIIRNTHTGSLSPPEVSTRPVFEMGSVSVTLEWIPEEGISYSVSSDQVVDLRYTQRTAVNLKVLYNTPTNVTITATSCGQNSVTAMIPIQLSYGRCEDPLLLISDDSVIAMGYHNLSVNGTVVTFSCPPGLTLNGSDSVMCTHTGQWEPALSEVNCDTDDTSSTVESQQCQISSSSNSSDGYIIAYNVTNDRIKVTFACQSNCEIELKSALELQTAVCTSSGDLETNPLNFCTDSEDGDQLTAVVASLTTMLLVFSAIIFTVGFICGQWFGRKFKGPVNQASSAHPQASRTPPVPIHESMLLDTTHEEQAIELEENVAYINVS